jgi:hypothetical protein
MISDSMTHTALRLEGCQDTTGHAGCTASTQ